MARFTTVGGRRAQVLQPAIASLTDNTTGTADDTLADPGASYTAATMRNDLADLAAKINSILAALRSAGIVKP